MPNIIWILFWNECLMVKLSTVYTFSMNFYAFLWYFPLLFPKLRPDLKLFFRIFFMGFVERKILYKMHHTRFSYSISRASKSTLQSKKTHKKHLSFFKKFSFFCKDSAFLDYLKRVFCSAFQALSNETLLKNNGWKITMLDPKY